MRFVIVNGRVPDDNTLRCSCCVGPLVEGYLREFSTGLYYCKVLCHQWSEKMACIAIEDHARRVS